MLLTERKAPLGNKLGMLWPIVNPLTPTYQRLRQCISYSDIHNLQRLGPMIPRQVRVGCGQNTSTVVVIDHQKNTDYLAMLRCISVGIVNYDISWRKTMI